MIVDELVTLLKFDVKGEGKAEKFKESLNVIEDTCKKAALGLGGMITSVALFADRVSKHVASNYEWAKSVGVAVDSYQKFEYAAQMVGGSLDDIKSDLEEWVRSAEASGMSLEEIYLREAKSIEGMTAAQSKALLSARGYSDISIRMLQKGESGLKEFLDRADVIPEEHLKAAQDYVDTWRQITTEFSTIGNVAVSKALPKLKEILGYIRQFLFENRDSIKRFITTFFLAAGNIVRMIYNSLKPFLVILGNIIKYVSKLTDGTEESNKAIRALEIGFKALLAVLAVSAIVNFLTWLGGLATAIWTVVSAVWAFSAALLTNPLTWFIALAVGAAWAIYTLATNWDDFVEGIKASIKYPELFFEALVEQLDGVIEKFDILKDMRDALGDAFYWIGKKIGIFEDYSELEQEMMAHPQMVNALTSLGGNGLNSVPATGTATVPNSSVQNSRSYVDNRNITINTNATSGPAIASYMKNNDMMRGGYGYAGAM